jgi:hypothetical protein
MGKGEKEREKSEVGERTKNEGEKNVYLQNLLELFGRT